MRIGIAHHLGWAVAVVAGPDHSVIGRRRVELIEAGVPVAPIHHEGGTHAFHRTGPELTDDELTALRGSVLASVRIATRAALDGLQALATQPLQSLSVRTWPADFPTDVAVLRRPPYESRADSIMYCHVLAELATERDWLVHRYDAKTVEQDAANFLGDRADDVLRGPRTRLGPPWAKDHRTALAATVLASRILGGGSTLASCSPCFVERSLEQRSLLPPRRSCEYLAVMARRRRVAAGERLIPTSFDLQADTCK